MYMTHIKTGPSKSKGMIALLLAALMAGCAAKVTALPATAPPSTPMIAPTPTSRPSPTASPPTALRATQDEPATPETTTDEVAGQLIVRRIAAPPIIDGQVDPIWTETEPVRLSLTWGKHGTEDALDVELRALRTDEALYLLAQWAGGRPTDGQNTTFNKLTMHWRIPDAPARRLDCAVACHTAFADGQGHFVYANAETIPHGGDEALPAAGGWQAGTWTLEWSRPQVNSNPYDLQFDDLERTYLFFVKVFERVEGRPDPRSLLHRLVFED